MNSSNEIEEWLKRTGKCLVILFGVNMLGILTIAYPILVGGNLITGGSAVIFYMVVEVIRSTADLIEAGKTPTRLLDVMGNTVGFIEIKESKHG